MGIMRWAIYNELKKRCSTLDIPVSMTYGYITKNTRIENGLPKEHYIDARCISGNPQAKPTGEVFFQKKVRCHNRQIHKNTIMKGGYRKRNQTPYEVMGFRLFDKLKWKGQTCFIFGRRYTGRFSLRLLEGTKIQENGSYKSIKLLETKKNYLTERRVV